MALAGTLAPPRGIVSAPLPDGLLVGRRVAPPARLAPFVHHCWLVRWELASPYTPAVLAFPAAQILHLETDGRREGSVVGVQTKRHGRTLVGSGQTFGLSFRPAMFHPLAGGSMARLTDRTVPLAELFGEAARTWTEQTLAAPTLEEKTSLAEAFLGPLLPTRTKALCQLRDRIERLVEETETSRVDELALSSGLETRALQRSFREHVGVSPKWVRSRFRLHEAAARLASPEPPGLADLAASLGYADQAHFGRDFQAAVGQTPRTFRRNAR